MADSASVREFFNELSSEYTGAIDRCAPRYREMLASLIEYLPDQQFARILDLGCGTGNLSEGILRAFPNAEVVLLDLSPNILKECRTRLDEASLLSDRVQFVEADFSEYTPEPASFDLIVSSIAIHHIPSAEKAALFKRLYAGLKSQGVFSYCDQFAGATPHVYETHMQKWRRAALDMGSTEADWDMWMEHQNDHDYHDTLSDQIAWLNDAGFEGIDCPWRYLLWTILQAQRSRA